MSKETTQWLEMIRRAVDNNKPIEIERHCEVCQDITKHTSKQSGNRESLTCTRCGCYREYTTK